jgi:putative SOS response-associated peptidase YedK
MCFHTEQTKLGITLETRFKAILDDPLEFHPQNHINGFEFPKTPVIIDEKPTIITHYNWGLIPAWAKDAEIQKYTLNAKIETVDEKPSFKNSVNKRCLVIADGYFEWQWLDPKGKNKQRYELCLPNQELFAFAGLYSHWVDANTGEIKNTYTILTTEANPLLAEIHNHKKRMPVVLKREDETKWLEHQPIQDFAFPYQVNLVAKQIHSDSATLL